MKYCQECGNASYDSAPVCGNCGAKLPPKSEANAKPPKLDGKSKGITKAAETQSSIFSGKQSSFGSNFSKKLGGFDLSKYSNTAKEKKAKEETVKTQSSNTSFTKATEGFKQKDKAIKNPAKKFGTVKTEAKKEEPKKEKIKKETPKKEVSKKVKEIKPKADKKPSGSGGSTINLKKIGIIAIIALIILLIAGIGLNGIQNQPTDEVRTYTDGTITFDYSGNWSMYNNTNGDKSSDIAFKTKDKTLIGFTTIQSDEITYEKILSDVNATAQSLNGELIDYKNVDVGGVPSLDMTISTGDQGYSRYICTLYDGVYYSFVINNGKSDNQDISALNTTEIQNMINSIGFPESIEESSDSSDYSGDSSSY